MHGSADSNLVDTVKQKFGDCIALNGNKRRAVSNIGCNREETNTEAGCGVDG